jgi:hypothetical protein
MKLIYPAEFKAGKTIRNKPRNPVISLGVDKRRICAIVEKAEKNPQILTYTEGQP